MKPAPFDYRKPKSLAAAAALLSAQAGEAKIRAGASVEQVASAAGVGIERVQRFANPVLLERALTNVTTA